MKYLFLILLSYSAYTQNIVPNPSFEIYSQCPTDYLNFNYVNSWHRIQNHDGDPDYFNTCGTSLYNVPTNIYGSQSAYHGNAYAGIVTYSNPGEIREYIEVQLTTPLTAGQSYLVSYYISPGEGCKYTSNGVGAIFTVSNLLGNGPNYALNITPHIWNQNIITNTSEWTLISGTYLASGNEQYITLGNFANAASTPFAIINPTSPHNYSIFYIDQVSVTQTLGNNEFAKQKTIIIPNPVIDEFTFIGEVNECVAKIEMYSIYNKVKTFDIEENSFNIEELPSGIYYLTVTYQSNKKSTTKIIKL